MSDRMTELDLVVGSMFTTRPEEDRDLYEDEREWLSDIQDLLREEGVEVDLLSRPGVEIWEGGIDRFMDLYQLRQVAAYLEQDRDIAPLLKAGPPSDGDPDPLLQGGGGPVGVELAFAGLQQHRVHVGDPLVCQQPRTPPFQQFDLVGQARLERVLLIRRHPDHVAVPGLVSQVDPF